jgi:hypothetical protein
MGGWKFRLLCPISVDEIHLKPHVGNHLNTYIYETPFLTTIEKCQPPFWMVIPYVGFLK